MNANERQVGGEHYRTKEGGVQHWDYCVRANVPNLEYAASKYLTRWRKKNGLEDLRKPLHYIEKRIESLNLGAGVLRGANKVHLMFAEFVRDNEIPPTEVGIIDLVMHWKNKAHLLNAREMLKRLIAEEEEKLGEPTSAYVNQD